MIDLLGIKKSLKENHCGLIKISIFFFLSNNLKGKLDLIQVPNRREFIGWNNNGNGHWCIYASLGHVSSVAYFVLDGYITNKYLAITIFLSPLQRNYSSK